MRVAVAIVAVLGLAAGFSSFYEVPEAQEALVVRFGRPVSVQTEPGLWMKLPFVDTVTLFDMRLLALEPPTEPVTLGDQKRIVVDSYTQFRIADPLRFDQSVRTLEQARSQLSQIVGASMHRVLGQVSLPDLLSPQRDAIIGKVRQLVADQAKALGIEVVDVGIRRAELPTETSQAIYDRMTSERQREAKELRAQGFEWAQEIKSKADRERAVTLADADLKGRITRNEGDAEASRLFAAAFGRDPKFFAFYRAMQSYRHALADSAPTVVLSPQSELMRFFNAGAPEGPPPGSAK
ncbi:MAG TPA: protease modulator HflC [Acidisphaera sp.]|nr:protease modulator HflC [Acidisphaera sp.]